MRLKKKKQKNLFFLLVTYTIIQSITSSEICALYLTHPSAHTPGAVGSQCCGTRRAVGGLVPCSRVSPQSWTIPARAEIGTHNLGLQVRRSIYLATTAPIMMWIVSAFPKLVVCSHFSGFLLLRCDLNICGLKQWGTVGTESIQTPLNFSLCYIAAIC